MENIGKSDVLLFRGRQTEFWEVIPSVFREENLSIEHELLQRPHTFLPNEFNREMDDFDVMAKYQHYGMCTRLLDLTTNPLVALYFACQENGKIKYKNELEGEVEKEPYGVVYYMRDYPVLPTDKEVRIVAAIAQMDVGKIKLKEIVYLLKEEGIISRDDYDKWTSNDGYKQFVEIIQSNYIVSPTYNNERLIRQSGMFLLPGCFNVFGNIVDNLVLEKSRCDFKDKFNGAFYIDGEAKEQILKELDRYNINEAKLFPELEHQLSYIRQMIVPKGSSPIFEKFKNEQSIDERGVEKEEDKIGDDIYRLGEFENRIVGYINQKNIDGVRDEIKDVIIKNTRRVDWYKGQSNRSRFIMDIAKILRNNRVNDDKVLAEDIYNYVIKTAKDLSTHN